jgi:hypothetical protein
MINLLPTETRQPRKDFFQNLNGMIQMVVKHHEWDAIPAYQVKKFSTVHGLP